MADNWANVDKQVLDFIKKNQKTNNQIKNAISANIEKDVEELRQCILKHIQSKTVKAAIIVEKGSNENEMIITFDETIAFQPSAFEGAYENSSFNIYNYQPEAYMPILMNEGYEVRHPRWKNYFGKGAKHEAENFIEKGIEDYQKKHKGRLNIKVEKTGTFNYKNYTSSINEKAYYMDDYSESNYVVSFY